MDSGFNSIKAIVDTVIMIVNVILILRSSKKDHLGLLSTKVNLV